MNIDSLSTIHSYNDGSNEGIKGSSNRSMIMIMMLDEEMWQQTFVVEMSYNMTTLPYNIFVIVPCSTKEEV